MSPTLWLALYRIRDAVRTPGGAVIHFGLPLILLALTGALFGNGHPFERRTLVVVGEDGAGMAGRLSRFGDLRIESAGAEEVALRKLRVRAVHAVLVPDDQGGGIVHVAARDELLGRGIRAALDDRVSIAVEPVADGAYLGFLFPGLVVWTVLVNGLLSMGFSLAYYRRTRFLTKLRTTPLSRAGFVAAQILARTVLVLGQFLVLFALAWLAFGLRLGFAQALLSALIVALGLVVFAGGGVVIAARIRNESSVSDLANAVTAVLLLASEVFFPVDGLPRPVRLFSAVLPSTQLVRLLRAVMLWGETSAAALLPGLLVLAGWGAFMYLVSVRAFRWDD